MSGPEVVVVATRNRHKVEELARILAGLPVRLEPLDAVAPDAPDLEEAEETFEGNARSKALQAAALTGLPVIADDSGLEVDALGGAPGVLSARFAGRHGDTPANNALLLERLSAVPDEERTARFRCVIAYCDPAEPGPGGAPAVRTFHGTCEGRIARGPRGEGGFGYDPLFLLPDRGLTVAELGPEEKDAVSHRGRAARALAADLGARLATR